MNILDYVYEIDDEIIKTYTLEQDDTGIYLQEFRIYHYSILGDAMIYKLIGKGYLEIEEACDKYNVEYFEKRRKVKKFSLRR